MDSDGERSDHVGLAELRRKVPKYSGSPFSAPIRFEPAMEAEYLASREKLGLSWRLIVSITMACYLIGVVIFSYPMQLGPPEVAFVTRLVLLAVMVPATLVNVLFVLWRPLRRWSVTVWILTMLINIGGMMFLRILFARNGLDVWSLSQLLTLLFALSIVQMSTSRMVTATLLGITVGTALEFWAFGVDIRSLLDTSTVSLTACVGVWLMFEFDKLLRINWYRERYLDQLASTDTLTGLGNRRYFDAMLRQMIRAATRERRNLALMLIDVDHFKSYNDHYGHPAGDQCLERLGRYLGAVMRRPHDFAARIGGEEFAVVWFDPRPEDAEDLAQQLLRGVAALGIAPAPGRGTVVTASGGLVQVLAPRPEEATEGIAVELMRRADAALYEAKRSGRDQLFIGGALGAVAQAVPC